MKRILSLLLALILCFSLFTVVFADCDHDWELTESTATCGAAGKNTYTCKLCGETKQEDASPTGNHTWSDWSITKNPTCKADGSKTRTCSVCAKTETVSIPKTPDQHVWGKWTPIDDDKKQYHIHTCSECGKTEKKEHTSSEWIVDEENKNHYKKCTECDAEFEKAPHVFEKVGDKPKWEKDADNHWQICSVCNYKTKAEAHKWDNGKVTKKATCVQKGVMTYTCTVCGATKTKELPITEHSWDGGNTTVKPTITEKGESTFKCIVCGKVATREIDPLGLSMTPEELLTVQNMTGNALGGRLDDEKWVILQGVTTEEEYARIQGGWPITVTLKVTDITNTIGGELTEEVRSAAGKQKIHCFLKMELSKEMYQDPAIPVTNTTEPIILSLTLPEELQEATSKRKERGFTVYRIDGDKAEKVAAQLSEDGQSLRLQTDTFGTYALTYHDSSRNGFDPIMLAYGAIGLATLGGVGYLVYKIIQTLREEDEEYDDE